MAGGSGTRLWPLSRRRRPKQLLRIFAGQSLLRHAFDRLAALLNPQQIYVITGRDHLAATAEELPEIPPGNLIGEPCARDTANAVGLAAHLLARKDPAGTMGVFTADHVIRPVDTFVDTVRRGFEAAEQHGDALVTFGIKPTTPHTGYGYIRRGRTLGPGLHEVGQFQEKPDLPTAEQYCRSGQYSWNSGMFAWRLPTIIDQFDRHQPEMAAVLRQVAADLHDQAKATHVLELFASLPRISIDYAIMEKAERILTVEMHCHWIDVGAWTSLAEVFTADQAGNVHAAPNVMTVDAAGNIFVSESDHLLAAVGLRDVIIIHAQDATLVCRRQDAQRIKELVEQVQADTGDRYM